MNLADFLRQSPMAQQRQANDSSFNRDADLAKMSQSYGSVQAPFIDRLSTGQVPMYTGNPNDVLADSLILGDEFNRQRDAKQAELVMNLMPVAGMLKAGSKLPMDEASRMGRAKDMGHTVDAYHGSTRDINEFSNKYGSPEGHYGPNHYFTNSQDDVGKNYAGEGPDLTQRLEIKAEQIKDDAAFHDPILKSKIEEMGGKSWDDFEYDEKLQLTRKLAKDHLGLENQGVTYPVKLNMKNPVKTHGKDETFFDYQAKYDDDPSSPYYEEFLGEEGKFIDLLDETQQAMRKWGVDDADDVMGKLQEANMNMEGLKASEFEDVIRNNIYEAYDQAGEMASPGALIADIYKRMGYDGIEMNAYDHFGGGRPFGKAMEGVDQDTLHHIVFEPNQIRSKFAQFDPANKNSGNILAGAGAGFLASQLLGQDR